VLTCVSECVRASAVCACMCACECRVCVRVYVRFLCVCVRASAVCELVCAETASREVDTVTGGCQWRLSVERDCQLRPPASPLDTEKTRPEATGVRYFEQTGREFFETFQARRMQVAATLHTYSETAVTVRAGNCLLRCVRVAHSQ
jgi:hypothetical protein